MYKIQPNAAYGENVEMGGILSIQIVGYYITLRDLNTGRKRVHLH